MANRTAGSGAPELWRAGLSLAGVEAEKRKCDKKKPVTNSFTDKVCTGSGPVCNYIFLHNYARLE